jgi:hypothetical protein
VIDEQSGVCQNEPDPDKHGSCCEAPHQDTAQKKEQQPMITGAFVRIKREGEWQSVDIAELSDKELDEFAEIKKEAGWMWAKFLAKWIRDNVVCVDNEE